MGFEPIFQLCRLIYSIPFYAGTTLLKTACSHHADHREADKEGFEPSEDMFAFSDLANRRIRPLCHLSKKSVVEDLHLYRSLSSLLTQLL